jgi:serine/threonine protein kinase/regulation of enolase protein 1 (concanavalin A-like superfamily)
MIPDNSDRQTPPRPSRNGVGGAQDIEETGSYPPAASWWPTAPVAGDPSTSHERFDFLGPPRADGEFGWLAHYRVLRLLGQGGMGLVFLAEDSLLARHVALKVIRPEIADAPGIALRFTREARATAAIKHDHIVTIYQVGQENGVLFLAMELLTGLSLAQWLERGQIPSVELVLRIGREIAAGLSAAHRQGLIHRDIKPANVWLEAPSGRVKILDFGMARSVREDVEITRSGVVMGTPAYMAPEQARGEPAGAGSDLFSLGCVIYRLCTCRLPFEGESVMAVLTALSTTTPRRPRDWRNELPPALDELVSRLLAKDPANRPESAEVVVKEIRIIERALFAERQRAERSAATPFSARVESTKPAPAQAAEKPSLPQAAARPRNRRRKIRIAAAVLAALMATAVVGFVFAPPHKRKVAIVAAGPASASAHDDGEALPPFTTPKTDGARTAQPIAAPEQVSPRVDRGAVSEPSLLTGLGVPQSKAAAKPALTHAPDDSQHVDPPAELVAPSVRKFGSDIPAASASESGRGPEVQARTAGEMEAWGDAVDPGGDCQFELDPPEDKVRIIVPGKTHILSAEIGRMNAPRILRDIKGDFDVSVRVAGTDHAGGKATTTLYSPYHGAGLLIWQDMKNYVRLEVATDLQHGKPRPYVNFEYRKEGVLAATSGMKNGDGWNHLRLSRRGDDINASFGPDGVRWTSFPTLTAKLKDRIKVGVAAINSSTKPLTAELEGLEVSQRPEAGANLKTGGLNP